MRKSIVALILSVLMLSGCLSTAVKNKLSKNAGQLDGYVMKMNAGNTTPEEDQELIQAMRIWTWSMNWTANDEVPPPDVRLILQSRTE